jgi:uncharacterized repeat protein (TIGR04138 family)
MAKEEPNAEERLEKILKDDPRYPRDAYEFVSETLGYTARIMRKKGHVTGQELCEGARRMAVERFGFLARTVLESWNIRKTDDIGNLVYIMIGADLLKKTEADSIADFHEVFDFEEAFDKSFKIELETKT